MPDYETLAPTLTSLETDFGTMMVSSASTKLLLFKFTALSLVGSEYQSLLFGATFSTGLTDDGQTISLLNYPAENTDQTVFYFRLTEDLSGVDLFRKQLNIRTSDAEMYVSTMESAPDEWVVTFPVVSVDDNGKGYKGSKNDLSRLEVVVLADDLLLNGFYVTGLTSAFMTDFEIDLSTAKGFTKNTDLTVKYLLNSTPTSTLPISIRFSIALLPTSPMSMRLSDERVGYFTTSYFDMGDHRLFDPDTRPSSMIDSHISIINKRRVSMDGNYTIVYYIDPSVPETWRVSLKNGVEAWKPAFEALGYPEGVIRAVLPGDSDWPDDYDASDIRFNSITWAVDMNEIFSIGPATIDPRSGEILRSNIVFTSGWIKAWISSLEKQGDSNASRKLKQNLKMISTKREKEAKGVKKGSMKEMMESRNGETLLKHFPHLKDLGKNKGENLRHYNFHDCQTIQAETTENSLNLVGLLKNGRKRKSQENFSLMETIIEQGLKDVAMHEVGHTLGLRHNFKGSIESSLADLQNSTYTGENGLTSTVMDYLPINIVSQKLREDLGYGEYDDSHHFFTPKIGSYDYWAIEYGYVEVSADPIASSMLKQYAELDEIATKAFEFGTDEDVVTSEGFDPMTSMFDLSSDPLSYFEDQLQLVSELRNGLLDRSVMLGEAFTLYAESEKALLRLVAFSGLYASKYIGGADFSKQRRVESDTVGPMKPIETILQRKALGLIGQILTASVSGNTTTDPQIFPSPDELGYMVQRGGYCQGLEIYCLAVEPFDPLSEIERLREKLLVNLVNKDRLKMVRLGSWGTTDDPFTASELLTNITNTIWGTDLLLSDRANYTNNWSLMLFWTNLLMDLSNDSDGEISSISSGEIYRIIGSASNTTTNSTVW
eukprot:CAMPEP_0171476112 /NCGR_PEP_ID=MMETSP0946-20130122/3401_1 /TAXON_ID=109269 /ORGANISM="Vaucheria litorea, Strain CCMP2940" /LENGTH=884 /DNA_ID=CAMNT_0012006321 /DNA_START=315 /DNA_END=2966 /DNA_ORIENTATION=+